MIKFYFTHEYQKGYAIPENASLDVHSGSPGFAHLCLTICLTFVCLFDLDCKTPIKKKKNTSMQVVIFLFLQEVGT